MPDTGKSVSTPRLVIHQSISSNDQSGFAEDVRAGLTATPKTLKPKYLYDALGSVLFEAICLLPEYYLTRAETEIFERRAAEIVAQLPAPTTVVELGSGSSIKTRLLIEAILARQPKLCYQPIDISETILEQSAKQLLEDYPRLQITAHAADYTRAIASIARGDGEKVLALFLGSNIGNYNPDEARELLRQIHGALRPGEGLLLGADLKKSRETLEAAYNDALNLTAAFSRNLLLRINRELNADFDLKHFKHRAFFNEEHSRIEIHLVSGVEQKVNIRPAESQPALEVDFKPGETIHTENSYKYDLEALAALARATGFTPSRVWFDSGERFSCNFWLA
ncbi:MAG TPA: L-histidine N(alpha)-methyltransferase [Blastocatellia bacterium]|nr:L-histidine N(alpha)-methyltransferase [Blastocatellia bacterium]